MKNDLPEFGGIPLIAWILLAAILLSQSIWLFTDAKKRGAKSWAWGIWGLTGAPTPLIVYLLVVRKIWNKKAGRIAIIIYALALVIIIAIGCIFHGDGPVNKNIFSNNEISDIKTIENTDTIKTINRGMDLFANIYFVESPNGTKYTAKWIFNNTIIKDETKCILTDKRGVISYMLEGSKVQKGSYSFEIYYNNKRVYKKEFNVN